MLGFKNIQTHKANKNSNKRGCSHRFIPPLFYKNHHKNRTHYKIKPLWLKVCKTPHNRPKCAAYNPIAMI